MYGLSFLYGASGSTRLADIAKRLQAFESGRLELLAKVAVVLVFGGLSFRIAAVPFHFYAPDVYHGTTHANAGFLSVIPKAAGLVALVRLLLEAVPGTPIYTWRLATLVAVLTMTLGNLVALWQSNLRRLLAYSSIAHAGYMLVGLCAYLACGAETLPKWDGVGALLFYLLVYALATIGAFATANCLRHGDRPVEDIEELAGLAWTGGPARTFLAWSLAACLFSLTGIPPLAGFWGKLALVFSTLEAGPPGSALHPWLVGLAVVVVVNSAVAAAYYLRIVGLMFFRLPLATPATSLRDAGPLAAALFCGLMVLLIGLLPGPWIGQANRASPKSATGAQQRVSRALSSCILPSSSILSSSTTTSPAGAGSTILPLRRRARHVHEANCWQQAGRAFGRDRSAGLFAGRRPDAALLQPGLPELVGFRRRRSVGQAVRLP